MNGISEADRLAVERVRAILEACDDESQWRQDLAVVVRLAEERTEAINWAVKVAEERHYDCDCSSCLPPTY